MDNFRDKFSQEILDICSEALSAKFGSDIRLDVNWEYPQNHPPLVYFNIHTKKYEKALQLREGSALIATLGSCEEIEGGSLRDLINQFEEK